MKVVLDTNVIVSGLLSPFGPPGGIVRMVASGTLELCYNTIQPRNEKICRLYHQLSFWKFIERRGNLIEK